MSGVETDGLGAATMQDVNINAFNTEVNEVTEGTSLMAVIVGTLTFVALRVKLLATAFLL